MFLDIIYFTHYPTFFDECRIAEICRIININDSGVMCNTDIISGYGVQLYSRQTGAVQQLIGGGDIQLGTYFGSEQGYLAMIIYLH